MMQVILSHPTPVSNITMTLTIINICCKDLVKELLNYLCQLNRWVFLQSLRNKVAGFLICLAVPNTVTSNDEEIAVICEVFSDNLWEGSDHLVFGRELLVLF